MHGAIYVFLLCFIVHKLLYNYNNMLFSFRWIFSRLPVIFTTVLGAHISFSYYLITFSSPVSLMSDISVSSLHPCLSVMFLPPRPRSKNQVPVFLLWVFLPTLKFKKKQHFYRVCFEIIYQCMKSFSVHTKVHGKCSTVFYSRWIKCPYLASQVLSSCIIKTPVKSNPEK